MTSPFSSAAHSASGSRAQLRQWHAEPLAPRAVEVLSPAIVKDGGDLGQHNLHGGGKKAYGDGVVHQLRQLKRTWPREEGRRVGEGLLQVQRHLQGALQGDVSLPGDVMVTDGGAGVAEVEVVAGARRNVESGEMASDVGVGEPVGGVRDALEVEHHTAASCEGRPRDGPLAEDVEELDCAGGLNWVGGGKGRHVRLVSAMKEVKCC